MSARLYQEVISQAIGSLLAHRFRAALTMLGISWGIVTVVLLMAYGTGFQRALMYGFRNAFSQGTVLVGNGQTSMQARGGAIGAAHPAEAGGCRRREGTGIDQVRQPGVHAISTDRIRLATDH